VVQKFFGQFWGKSGKSPSQPQKFACSYTYDSSIHVTKNFRHEAEGQHASRLENFQGKICFQGKR